MLYWGIMWCMGSDFVEYLQEQAELTGEVPDFEFERKTMASYEIDYVLAMRLSGFHTWCVQNLPVLETPGVEGWSHYLLRYQDYVLKSRYRIVNLYLGMNELVQGYRISRVVQADNSPFAAYVQVPSRWVERKLKDGLVVVESGKAKYLAINRPWRPQVAGQLEEQEHGDNHPEEGLRSMGTDESTPGLDGVSGDAGVRCTPLSGHQ
jgi:hypothetical protein